MNQLIVEVKGRLEEGRIVAEVGPAELARMVFHDRKIVLIKEVFPEVTLLDLRQSALRWGRETPLAETDDFGGNYHRQRAMVSFRQKWPHVFHDYNFNDFSTLDDAFRAKVFSFFEPLRLFYNELSSNQAEFPRQGAGLYSRPQLIHYPRGGGFFARHWHDLMPQKLGFIVSMSKYGTDYPNGGTMFSIDDELVDIEGLHDMGDICLWRYDYHHWVKQSDLCDPFDWNSEDGRWVATLPYYDLG